MTATRLSPGRAATILVALAAAAAGLTMLFIGMRAVMDIGGACASGNPPFTIEHPCPRGVALLTIGGVWLGIIAAMVYVWSSLGSGIPSFAGLLWPALFISLGWNFLEYAVDPPGDAELVWGWLIPGILFMIMGGVPLWLLVGSVMRRRAGKPVPTTTALYPPGLQTAARVVKPGPSMLTRLAALDAAYQAGSLTSEEYERAKARIQGETG